MSAALDFSWCREEIRSSNKALGTSQSDRGLFPIPFSPVFPFSKKGVLLSFIRTFPLTEVRTNTVIPSNGTFRPSDREKGTPQQASPLHPDRRAAVYGVTKDIKLPRLLKIGDYFLWHSPLAQQYV